MSDKDDIEKLLRNHKRRLQKLKEAQALYGLETPPQIVIEIENIETEIEGFSHYQAKSHNLLRHPL